jgi:hypothetical protein
MDDNCDVFFFAGVLPKFTYFSQFKVGGFVYTGAVITCTVYLCIVSIFKW